MFVFDGCYRAYSSGIPIRTIAHGILNTGDDLTHVAPCIAGLLVSIRVKLRVIICRSG